MRPQTYTVSASAAGNSHSGIFIPDVNIDSFSIGYGAVVATTAKYTIQHTFQDPLSVSAGGLTWHDKTDAIAASANTYGSYNFPVAGIRVRISASNEGGVSTTFIQSGMG